MPSLSKADRALIEAAARGGVEPAPSGCGRVLRLRVGSNSFKTLQHQDGTLTNAGVLY